MTCCAPHAEADRDHKPVPNWDTTGDCDDCTVCGLAVTGLGERHGFDDEPNGHEEYESAQAARRELPEENVTAEAGEQRG